ncbi:TPA: ChbG/HpnK family deacetylase, partial [Enterococcus faecium]|nr:ChbG/HpnK family deacetylase [Enterococcus faecium]HCR2254782.1 ChbG/HpnK family deacetylase [Enterococcus faecium]HCR2260566.1 ChbG/HpnK family deacetylase [Enterococcus faecium]HCR2263477.1 ChbG/HpnK family deacetylase [Enterococcus faecium]HCR2266376.1 ChbG/HpnK family deacetylase [Enterococcus faecium]
MGKVIFNSDDFGYSHGVNYGIMDAYQRGILTSTTLMAN